LAALAATVVATVAAAKVPHRADTEAAMAVGVGAVAEVVARGAVRKGEATVVADEAPRRADRVAGGAASMVGRVPGTHTHN
jgi:hypothetical protein